MGQIIACGNLKGGVGKTTVAVNLACALAVRAHEVTVLDIDPQGSASMWASAGRLPVPVEAMPQIEHHGGGRWPARAGELAVGERVVVLDLPPLLVPTLASALMIADVILVPITPSALDVAPTARTLRMARMTRESRAARKPKGLLVPNRVDPECRYDPATRGGDAPDGRKVRATLHWVATGAALPAEVRLYDHLFLRESPGAEGDFLDDLNPASLEVLAGCMVEPALAEAAPGAPVQFERQGYFCADPDSSAERLVFNRTVALRDTWAKISKAATSTAA